MDQKAVDSAYLYVLTTKQNSSWMSVLQLNNTNVQFKLDTGAEVTVISQETYTLLGELKLCTPTKIIRGSLHQPLKVLGQIQGMVRSGSKAAVQTVSSVAEDQPLYSSSYGGVKATAQSRYHCRNARHTESVSISVFWTGNSGSRVQI